MSTEDTAFDYQSMRARAVAAARSEFAALPDASAVVETLATWVSWVRQSARAQSSDPGTWFNACLTGGETNPVAWCSGRRISMPENPRSC
jgi:hypothetical protein